MARVVLLLHTTGGETRLPEALQEYESDEWDGGQDTVAGARTGPCRFECQHFAPLSTRCWRKVSSSTTCMWSDV